MTLSNPDSSKNSEMDGVGDSLVELDGLLHIAQRVVKNAVAPSSQFRVGAALQASDGSVFSGCNIESPVYLGVCAERVALFKGLSEGFREFRTLVIFCEEDILCPPCGTCRQLLWEFAPTLQVVLVNVNGTRQSYFMRDLLPTPFDRGNRDPFRNP